MFAVYFTVASAVIALTWTLADSLEDGRDVNLWIELSVHSASSSVLVLRTTQINDICLFGDRTV
jgi:hypothetical protein